MVEQSTHITGRLAPFSEATLREMYELGLEAEDIQIIIECRGDIHNRIQSLIDGNQDKRIIRLEKRIREEAAIFLKTAESQLQNKIQDQTLREKYKKFCNDDLKKWQFVIQHILDQDETTIKAAIELADEFGDDINKMKQVADIVTAVTEKCGYDAYKALVDLKEMFGSDINKMNEATDIVAAVAEKSGRYYTEHAYNALVNLKEVYGSDMSKLKQVADIVAAAAKKGGYSACEALVNLKEVYGSDINKMNEVAEIVAATAKKGGYSACYALVNLKEVYGSDISKLKQVADIVLAVGEKTSEDPAYNALVNLKEIFGSDMSKLKQVADIVAAVAEKGGYYGCQALVNLKEVYGSDISKLKQVADIVLAVGEKTSEDPAYNALVKLKEMFGSDINKMNEVADIVLTTAEKGGVTSCKALVNLKEVYGSDMSKFQQVADIVAVAAAAEKGGSAACEALVNLKEVYGSDINKMNEVADIVLAVGEKRGYSACQALVNLKEVYGNDITRFQKAGKYAEATKIFDKTVLAKYIEIFEQEGEAKALEYLQSLPAKAKGLVSSRTPESHRALPEYQYLVRYVFPDGNYSSYEQNLACGDSLEHVNGYEFDREGYPTVLTGLLGYKLKEGIEPDQQVLNNYTERLGRIRQFVTSRGPDNKALQENFEAKIDRIFKEKAWPEFQGITGLTLKEKMLCLFLGEAFSRKQKGESKEPDDAICDLIVEYKYAFHEDLEAYVARSADSVKAYQDKASQDYMLLAELSVIYGENVKHILRHNIFEELEDSKNYDRIVEVFSEKLGGTSENKDLTPKQWQRVDNTFTNERIPLENKPKILYKQVYDIFSSNIKFESDEKKNEFNDKFNAIFAELGDNLTVERVRELLPKFYKLRDLYRSGINTQLTELFTYDINQIFEELAKYEENIEEEGKEKRIGGEKEKLSKKSSKKRNIRGFFTKTAETANARMGAYLCIAGDSKMWKNENYFEMVLVDEENNKCVGVVMLLAVQGKDGQKYLWFGPNPFESFLDVVSSQMCYQYLYERTCEFAEQNNFAGVVVPSKDEQILGQCTNRGGDFPGFIKASRLKDKNDNLIIVDFDQKHTLGGGYGYENGALIWKRKKGS